MNIIIPTLKPSGVASSIHMSKVGVVVAKTSIWLSDSFVGFSVHSMMKLAKAWPLMVDSIILFQTHSIRWLSEIAD